MSPNESAMSSVSRRKAYRAAIVHSLADPAEVALEASYEYFADGLLLVEDGKIVSVGHAADL
ncbi:guanine deaminase, partial [Pseudomonas syringae pv. japonica str. M301072]